MDGQPTPVPRGVTGWVGLALTGYSGEKVNDRITYKNIQVPMGPLMGLLFEFYESKGYLTGTLV